MPSEEALKANPAVKLLDFYEGLSDGRAKSAELDTKKTEGTNRC